MYCSSFILSKTYSSICIILHAQQTNHDMIIDLTNRIRLILNS